MFYSTALALALAVTYLDLNAASAEDGEAIQDCSHLCITGVNSDRTKVVR